MLDLWQNDNTASAPQPTEGADLPAGFGETFDAAWNEGRLFAQSVAGENARWAALQDHIDDLSARTGKNINQQIDLSGSDVPGVGFVPPTAASILPQVNAAAQKLGQPELTDDDLDQRAVEKSRAAQTAYAAIAAREKGSGGGLGEFLGGAAAAATDPINIAALPVAPEAESTSILTAALRFGAVAGVAQAGIEAAGGAYRETVQPGYLESGAPVENVLSAAGQGAVLGGVTRGLGNLWTRVKTGAWPQSVRDAGNLIESEANIADSNVYPGADGEVAHRQALSDSIDKILKGDPVDVSRDVSPEMDVQAGALPLAEGSIEQARAAAEDVRVASEPSSEAQPQLPFEATAAVARMRQTNEVLAGGVAQVARRAGYDMPAEESARIADRLVKAPPEEADGMLRDLQVNPRAVAEWAKGPAEPQKSPLVSPPAQGPSMPVSPVTESTLASPDFNAALRADIDRDLVKGDVQIPVDVDKDGNPIHRSVGAAMDEVDAYKTAADQIAACAAPEPEPAEAEAA